MEKLLNIFGYSNEEIANNRKKDDQNILNKYGEYFVVFDFTNNTMFSPNGNSYFPTIVFSIVVPFKREVDAWRESIIIEKQKSQDAEIGVITLNDANNILKGLNKNGIN